MTRSVVRKMESVWRKLINFEAAVSFNKICLEEGIIYLIYYIYLHIGLGV